MSATPLDQLTGVIQRIFSPKDRWKSHNIDIIGAYKQQGEIYAVDSQFK